MEHSLLHGLELNALFLTCGGPLLVLLFLRPAWRPGSTTLGAAMEASTARWIAYGALTGALANLADLVVETAELQGQTVLGSWDMRLLWAFATHSLVGQLALARIVLFLLTAALTQRSFRGRWPLLGVVGFATLLTTALVSHAAAQPTARPFALSTQILHLTAGAAWLGVLMHLLAASRYIEALSASEDLALLARVVQRFSPWALLAVSLLFVSGLAAVLRSFTSPHAVLISPYGLTLLVKLALLCPAFYAGYVNFSVIRPGLLTLAGRVNSLGLEALVSSELLRRRFGRLLELEVTAGVLVVVIAGVLGSISPPNTPGDQELTLAQTRALLHPHWPRTTFVHPAAFYGAAQRTIDDLHYSEFMHNWSGLIVLGLGLCWLGSVSTNRCQTIFSRAWPWLLAGFALFIGLASDPELWLHDRVSLWQIFRDPEVFEHKLGALLLALLAALAFRYPAQKHRLSACSLPLLMLGGSILLLGHAHSTLTSTDELVTLINVQHAILGACGLFAGTLCWCHARQLPPSSALSRIWPLLVMGLGLLMTFFYRETW